MPTNKAHERTPIPRAKSPADRWTFGRGIGAALINVMVAPGSRRVPKGRGIILGLVPVGIGKFKHYYDKHRESFF